MQIFAIANPSSSAAPEVRERLSVLGVEFSNVLDEADVVILAVGALEGRALVMQVGALRERVSCPLIAVFSAGCQEEDWRALLGQVPVLLSAGATQAEIRSRVSDAADARTRMELTLAGEKRLSLLRQSLEEVSMIDMRTGMYNRRFLMTRLREALSAALRYDRPLTLCVFRIADYEDLLEEHGDDMVSVLTEALSDQLSASLRSADVQAWMQRDEFALLLPETPSEGAQRVVDRVVEQADTVGADRGVAFRVVGHYASPGPDERSAERFVERARRGLEK